MEMVHLPHAHRRSLLTPLLRTEHQPLEQLMARGSISCKCKVTVRSQQENFKHFSSKACPVSLRLVMLLNLI